jgi:allantoinase
MTLAPGRFDYAPITERPVIRWPGSARVAFWVAPNMEFFEYMPESRPTQPDIPLYARMDYGNRVGFWRMLDVLNRHKVRACCCLTNQSVIKTTFLLYVTISGAIARE